MKPHIEDKQPLLDIKNLKKYFPIRTPLGRTRSYVKAVDDVSFTLFEGETYGLVGESGCGKSTTGRTILRLLEPTAGECLLDQQDIFQMNQKELRDVRKRIQMVFQDPYSALNPKKRIGKTLEESLAIHRISSKKVRTELVMELLHKVGFQKSQYYRYPHEFSGGQRQRIGLARALILNPKIVICDEPVSALDVSIQSQVINLLEEVQEEFKLTYLFVAHDLSVVRHISDRVGVMYLGHIIEEAKTDDLYKDPLHPYTKALISAVPIADPKQKRERIALKGEIPSPINPPSGCVFHTRCPYVMERCKTDIPALETKENGHRVACHLYDDM
ncbi:peptide/nickel transport system ATP-binding protein/oligopeptide transport system ATP-binding protein [Bacillus horti]|uniref:Peptide/nickel transport system ATP-binding protein/oligopeptide transport system ATP-binding protein n=1 Tax=Caldalkalibacillus horti TaxID=77523 RepID=A0ABT9VV76_9BACI|nr:dipeptide ABC transporter ATP-binding protein [Bacillus horti]MDQ0164883.1 peptide/nickel transport system ATP-binding protein/oligopeptide transport system ATP-binding protein [Bacillus horti]